MTESEILHTCKKEFKKELITRLKIDLYVHLLNMSDDEITVEELCIMEDLSKDKDIQKLLEDKRKEGIKNGRTKI